MVPLLHMEAKNIEQVLWGFPEGTPTRGSRSEGGGDQVRRSVGGPWRPVWRGTPALAIIPEGS